MKYRCPLKNIRVNTDLAKDIFIMADRNQFQQVLFNILINSVEAMPMGGEITIRTYASSLDRAASSKDSCTIEITDTGLGISSEHIPRLFEPFFTTKRDKKGTGLGLSIAKTIVNNHNGELTVESKLKKGTTVKVTLPLAP